jgi:hypothetical protein
MTPLKRERGSKQMELSLYLHIEVLNKDITEELKQFNLNHENNMRLEIT